MTIDRKNDSLRDALRVIVELEEALARATSHAREPIAIVGMGERFPGDAPSFWETLVGGADTSREVPADRWDADAYHDPDPRAPGKSVTKRASFLRDVRGFDAPCFAIARAEAQAMDPQQRLLLEVAWEALEHAGLPLDRLAACRTGVFVGACAADYRLLCPGDRLPDALAPYAITGGLPSVLAGRVSYALGLKGPSLVVDTACSSSLVALHLACTSLRLRESDVALACGVNLMLSPASMVALSKTGALSPDGRCKAFAAAADGFGRGEGCGAVVLKRLSDAVRDGDRVLALVRGSAINQDGRSDGLTAPSVWAQQQVIRDALAFADLTPSKVQYVEAHGTGTALGDPIEIEALAEVFGQGPARSAPLSIGTAKSNIGHLEGAAGIAGVIKTVWAINQRRLPASLHFDAPNPHVPWETIPIRVQTELGPWPTPEAPLVAGVSSFGISGTNAHAIVSEGPREDGDAWAAADALSASEGALVLAVSAASPAALRARAERYAEILSKPLDPPLTWRDVAYTSCVRRTHMEHRLSVTGSSAREWVALLRAFARDESPNGATVGRTKESSARAVFVFTGEASARPGMGRELLDREPVFRAAIERCAELVDRQVSFRLLDELRRDEASSRLEEPEIARPAVFALQVGLCALWSAWGIEPAAVVGQGVGEIAAAHVTGVSTLEAAVRRAVLRPPAAQRAAGAGELRCAIDALVGEGYDAFVEVGPHPSLSSAIAEAIDARGKTATLVSSLRRDEPERDAMLRGLGALHAAGYPVDWARHFGVRGRVADLPSYPWQREPYWFASADLDGPRATADGGAAAAARADRGADELRRNLRVRSARGRVEVLDRLVRELLGEVLGRSVDDADATAPLARLGLDSLSSLDLRDRIEDAIGMRVASTEIWNYPTIAGLCRFLVDLVVPEDARDPREEAAPAGAQATAAEALGDLTDDEAGAVLAELDAEEQGAAR